MVAHHHLTPPTNVQNWRGGCHLNVWSASMSLIPSTHMVNLAWQQASDIPIEEGERCISEGHSPDSLA